MSTRPRSSGQRAGREAGPRPKPPRPSRDRALEVGAQAPFEDPAYYTKTYRGRREDVAYYEALGASHRGPLLEYGVGNGRLALPMARAGSEVTGVDWSAPMLADLEQRLTKERPEVRARVSALSGDMREVRLGRRFPLVICAFNTFLHLYTRDDVERFFAGVRAHLSRGGRFVMDVAVPHPNDLRRDPNRAYQAAKLVYPGTGKLVRCSERFDYDDARQILFVTTEFTPADGEGDRWVVPLAHRQFFPQEIEALLHYNGFEVRELHGGFEGEPLSRHSELGVWVCEARSGRR